MNTIKNIRRSNTVVLVECSLLMALSVVLSMVKVFEFPQGGAITAAGMVPVAMIALRHGSKWGLGAAFTYSLLQMALGFVPPPAADFVSFLLVILLDYVLAFTGLGLSWIVGAPFRKHRDLSVGMGVFGVCMLRYLCSFLSGILIWGEYAPVGTPVWIYSLSYNGAYMIPEAILSVFVAVILVKFLDKAFPTAQSPAGK